MARFSELGVSHPAVIGKRIDIEELFDRRILIEKAIIGETKYPGRNHSGLCMHMQVCLATFNERPDSAGDWFAKDADGAPIGERRSCFTGSDNLIGMVQQAERTVPEVNRGREKNGQPPLQVFPLDVTITKAGKGFLFK